MKQILTVLFISLFFISCEKEKDALTANLEQENIIDFIDEQYSDKNFDTWVSKTIIKANETVYETEWGKIVAPDYDSWLIIMNEYPMINCIALTYIFVNAETGVTESARYGVWPNKVEFDKVKQMPYSSSQTNSSADSTIPTPDTPKTKSIIDPCI